MIRATSLRTLLRLALITLSASGCALYSDVSIAPLNLSPANIDRGSDLQAMVKKGDYLRAIEMTALIESRPRKTAADLGNLGTAELAAGRYHAARPRPRGAAALNPFHSTFART